MRDEHQFGGSWSRLRHRATPKGRRFDPAPSWPPTGKLDDRFTEDQPRYAAVYEWLQYAQYSPRALKRMPTDLLVYIAGHRHRPPRNLGDLDWVALMAEATKDHKLLMNAERAAAELSMRRNRRVIWASSILAALVTLAAAFITRL